MRHNKLSSSSSTFFFYFIRVSFMLHSCIKSMNRRRGLTRRLLPISKAFWLLPHITGWCSALYSWLQSNETASIRFAQHWWTPYVVHRPYTVVFFFVPCLVFPSLYPTKLSVFAQGERSGTQHPVNITTTAKLFTRREVNVWHFSLLIFFFFWCIYFSSSPDRFVFRCYSRDKWL